MIGSNKCDRISTWLHACRSCHKPSYPSVQKHDARLDKLLKLPDREVVTLFLVADARLRGFRRRRVGERVSARAKQPAGGFRNQCAGQSCRGVNMKFFPLVLALLFSAEAFVGPAATQPASQRIWITDVTIVSPENLAHLAKGSVLIENGRIARVERTPSAKAPAGTTVVSGEGGFLIPGLIDSHVHLASVPGVPLDMNLNPDGAHA